MFGRKDDSKILFDNPGPVIMREKHQPVFITLEGALAEMDDMGVLSFKPRGKIRIQVCNIAGYYDHTILLMGNKVRVMESANEIELAILEAVR